MSDIRIDYHIFTHPNRPGRRAVNEDAVLAAGRVFQGQTEAAEEVRGDQPRLFAVSDGLHGSPCAALASRSLLEKLEGLWESRPGMGPVTRMEALQSAYAEAIARRPKCQGMACTLLAAEIRGFQARLIHVGDSRAWHIRDGRATRLTRDHTVLEGMIRSGEVDRSDADRYASTYDMLENYFMASPYQSAPECDGIDLPLESGDLLLVATDGLSILSDGDICAATGRDFGATPKSLFEAASAAGSDDNISMVLVRVRECMAGRGISRDCPTRQSRRRRDPLG